MSAYFNLRKTVLSHPSFHSPQSKTRASTQLFHNLKTVMTTSRGNTYYFSPGFTNWCSCLGFFGKLGGFRFMSSRLFLSISSLSEAIRSCCLQNTHTHKGNSKTVKQTATCSSSKYHWKTSKCITR